MAPLSHQTYQPTTRYSISLFLFREGKTIISVNSLNWVEYEGLESLEAPGGGHPAPQPVHHPGQPPGPRLGLCVLGVAGRGRAAAAGLALLRGQAEGVVVVGILQRGGTRSCRGLLGHSHQTWAEKYELE